VVHDLDAGALEDPELAVPAAGAQATHAPRLAAVVGKLTVLRLASAEFAGTAAAGAPLVVGREEEREKRSGEEEEGR